MLVVSHILGQDATRKLVTATLLCSGLLLKPVLQGCPSLPGRCLQLQVRFEITAFIGVIVLAGVVVVPMTLRLGEGAEIGSQYHWPVETFNRLLHILASMSIIVDNIQKLLVVVSFREEYLRVPR
jgi:hypothetical protein